MTDRNLFEAHLAGDGRQSPFVVGEAPAVHQDDRHSPESVGARCQQVRPRLRLVQRAVEDPVRADAFVDLDDPVTELVVEHDVPGEQVRTALPADAQGIAEPSGDRQDDGLALALQQGVGGHGGAHADFGDEAGGEGAGRDPENPPHALDRGIGVLLGIVRQQFARLKRPVRRAGDDVREGAAPVDPEAPARRHPGLRCAHEGAPTRSTGSAYRRLRGVCSARGLSQDPAGC